MKRAELADGTILEFPDDTDDAVIEQVVKRTIIEQQQESEGRDWGKLALEEGPRAIGATVGAITGGAAGSVPGAAGGAALGGAFGESVTQIIQHLMGDPKAPETSLEAATQIGKAGAVEGALELGGGYLMKGGMKVLAPFARKVEPGVELLIQQFKNKVRPVFLPAERVKSRVLDVMQNISENSIFGGGRITKFKQMRQGIFDDIADDFIAQFGKQSTPEQIGDLVVEVVERKLQLNKMGANVLYNRAEQLAGDVAIPTKTIKSFVEPMKGIAEELGTLGRASAGDDLVEAVIDLPDTLTYAAAKELRSRLISVADEFQVINKRAPVIGKAKKLVSLIDAEMEKTLSTVNKEALTAWRAANEFYQEGQKKFNNAMIRRLLKMADDTGQGAETIAPYIFRPGKVTTIRKVKAALREKDWPVMQRFFSQELVEKARNDVGELQGTKLLKGLKNMGDDVVREVLSQKQINNLKEIGEALALTQAAQGEGAGKVLIQLTQAGAVGGLWHYGLNMEAGVVLVGPALLSQLMVTDVGAKLIIEGIKLPAKSPQFAGFVARMSRLATETLMENEKRENFSGEK